MTTPPTLPLPLIQPRSTAIPRSRPHAHAIRRPPPARRTSPPDRTQAPEPPLLLTPLAAAHRRIRTISGLIEIPALTRHHGRHTALHIRRAAEPRRLPPQPSDLPFPIAFPLLDLLLAELLQLRAPLVAEPFVVVPPPAFLAVDGEVVDFARGDQAAGFAGFFFELQYGFVDRVRYCGEPLPAEAFVGAGLLRQPLGCAGRVEEGPFEAV